jgi:DtxR family Mn-dependent transcriptional regulator
MALSEEAQEILETLWLEREGETLPSLASLEGSSGYNELSRTGLVTAIDGRPSLTGRGLREAEGAIRRHRLAERLMADLFDVNAPMLDEVSCQFEHVLYAGIEDRVCRLLGHPRECPHGKPIPEGDCCRAKGAEGDRLVSRLTELDTGSKGRVAYLSDVRNSRVSELIAVGMLPGISVRILRKFPTYVLALGESELAIDQELAHAVFVRVHGNP